jgi:hypothetical protein
MILVYRSGWAGLPVALAAGLVLSGCGTPGAPLPPSLNLPERVTDLAAIRAGNQVSLTWIMPKKNTDKLLLKGNIQVWVCRKEGAGACEPAGNLLLAPGAAGTFTETLPPTLASGAPRPVAYFVELRNRNGRSVGLSNAAVVLAGEAPTPVTGLVAQVRKNGVVLRWTPESGTDAIRLHRKLLMPEPAAKPKPQQGLLAAPPEPVEESLLVEAGEHAGRALDRALDKEIRFGRVYEYRAQRVARVTVDGRALELAGTLSAPVRVEALDVFPPEAPAGLAAVATAAAAGTEASIDLSWQPGTEADLAGYAVYRREGGGWQRISPAEPLIAPAFRDNRVQPGHTYRYSVSAIDQGGHESARSAEAEETAPNP